jgi:SAM-dependent methyltransferase
MADWIRLAQQVIGKLIGRPDFFDFTPEYWDEHGLLPSRRRAAQRALGRYGGIRFFSRTYPGVVGRVHIHDSMLQNDSPQEIEHYIGVGASAMENIEASLTAAGRSFADVRACLDMASGYGRVLRLLQTRIDPGRITVCDIEDEAVRFLAAEFGVTPVVSQKDFRSICFPRKYDLIWVGSLFTHLEPTVGFDLLDLLTGLLEPGGVLIFSTQGAGCLELLAFYGWMFVPQEGMFREKVAGEGIAYAPYYPENDPTYGITLYRRDRLETRMAEKFAGRLKLVRFADRGWDNHQDVWAFQKL